MEAKAGSTEHLGPRRGWMLVRDRGSLAPNEHHHLKECEACNDWLSRFIEMARHVGFEIPFQIPELTRIHKWATHSRSHPFLLTDSAVDAVITSPSPGVFLLGQTDRQGLFHTAFVGRSDEDIRVRLKEHVMAYPEFQFEYCGSTKEAFDEECRLYHLLQPPDNKTHPVRPESSTLRCPRCLELG